MNPCFFTKMVFNGHPTKNKPRSFVVQVYCYLWPERHQIQTSSQIKFQTWIKADVHFVGSHKNSTALSWLGFVLISMTPTDIGISIKISSIYFRTIIHPVNTINKSIIYDYHQHRIRQNGKMWVLVAWPVS